jgi:hypothetical protein
VSFTLTRPDTVEAISDCQIIWHVLHQIQYLSFNHLFNSGISTSDHIPSKSMFNSKQSRKKQTWSDLRYCSHMCLQGMRKTPNISN